MTNGASSSCIIDENFIMLTDFPNFYTIGKRIFNFLPHLNTVALTHTCVWNPFRNSRSRFLARRPSIAIKSDDYIKSFMVTTITYYCDKLQSEQSNDKVPPVHQSRYGKQ